MAQPKQLKKLARERMERTGESYTQARNALLAGKPERGGRPAAAVGQGGGRGGQRTAGDQGVRGRTPGGTSSDGAGPGVPGEEELPEYPAPDNVVQYESGLWHRVLTQAGVTDPHTGAPFSEAMLSGLSGGIGFMVFTFEYEQTTTATVVTRAHPEPFAPTLFARLGVPVRETHTASRKQALDHLEAGLDAGRAVVVRVLEGALPWIEDGGDPAESESVDVVVVGEEDGFLVDDGSGSLRVLDATELADARAMRKKDRHWQAWVPEPVSPGAKHLRAAVREAAAHTAARMLGAAELPGLPAHFAKNFGVAGLDTWAGKLRDTTTKRGWTALFAEEERLRGGLAQLAGFFDSDRFCGAGGLRGLYADFLEEAAVRPGLEALGPVAGRYRDLAPMWEELSELVDPDVDVEERSGLFARMADLVERIARAEEAAARELQEAAGGTAG
ncbi:DUF4872 domain-containing protein [Zafaria sp. Z1313]|uniref:DUF4872 domain-containing protein n=1 Tax=unclassified Zafaria TaxID=2828765 RepID=UPI002E75E8B7|nr:DUF4872 domain-containing protein [Zafaria sp. J156]MEE1620462.1 DUF4872 domain-containing protein [Zafaria sp. J156]